MKTKQQLELIPAEEWGRRLKAAFRAAELTPGEAARILGVKRESVRPYLDGKRVPSVALVVHWVDRLGLDQRKLIPEFFLEFRPSER